MEHPVEIIPVIDLYRQQVVHAVAGLRDNYRAIESTIVKGSDPLAVATALRKRYEFQRLYVADLDSIRDSQPNVPILNQLLSVGFDVMLDLGIGSVDELQQTESMLAGDEVEPSKQVQWIIGLESLESRGSLRELAALANRQRLIFSLDLRDGQPMTEIMQWQKCSPTDIVCECVELGFREIIVLDLVGVGVASGCPTLELCGQIRDNLAAMEQDCRMLTGGGIRSQADVEQLSRVGVDGALISTALHRGVSFHSTNRITSTAVISRRGSYEAP